LLSASGVFHSPTTLTVIPKVVKESEIDEAMALHTIVRDISKLAGPAIGGMIIARWSVGHAFAVHSICLVFSAIMVMLMNIGHIKPEPTGESVVSQLKGGFIYAWSQKTLFTLLLSFGLLNLFVVPIIVLLPLSIEKIFLAGNPAGADGLISLGAFSVKGSLALGISEGVLAFGSVLTGLFFVKLFSKFRNSKILTGALIANATLFFIFSANSHFSIFLIGLFLLGSCFTSVNVAVLSLFQRTVAVEMKGRFFAFVEVLSFALFPISLAAAGTLSDKIGVEKCFLICGLGIAAIVSVLMMKKDLREIDK
jgi:predicted MFS family arabinose efflux permease